VALPQAWALALGECHILWQLQAFQQQKEIRNKSKRRIVQARVKLVFGALYQLSTDIFHFECVSKESFVSYCRQVVAKV